MLQVSSGRKTMPTVRRIVVLCCLAPVFHALFFSILSGGALWLLLAPHVLALRPTSGATIFVDDTINDGLIAHWKFDEVNSATARDFVGTAHGALQNGASLIGTPLPPMTVANAGSLSLDGFDDRVAISDTAALDLTASFSVAAWVKRSSTGTYDAIYDSGEQANTWWMFIADGSPGKDNQPGFGERGIAEVYAARSITDTNWHHLAFVKNGDRSNNLTFYVDGQPSGTASVGTVTTPSGDKHIGVLHDGVFAASFGGNLDEVRVYNRALSATEVQRLAQGHGCVTDGSSWATALRELQCALDIATSGDNIWVAAGAYRASSGRSVSFQLIDNVALYGGFLGTESSLNQRPIFDPNAPLTVLNGDLNGDDNPNTLSNYADNTRNLVVASAGISSTLDGFQIRGGNADGVSPLNNGGGVLALANVGSLRLNDVLFFANKAASQGGGVFSQSPITISAATFISNSAGSGGAMMITATAVITNGQFLSNTASLFGGGLYAAGPVTLSGGSFQNNRATTFNGGAINVEQTLDLNAVTFTRNQAGFSGGAIETGLSLITVTNSTFTFNQANTFSGGAIDATGPATIQASTFNTNTAQSTGGAVSVSGPAIVLGSQFNANRVNGINCGQPTGCSQGDGGAIGAGDKLIVSAASFVSNTARLTGGGIFAANALTITNGLLDKNVAQGGHGGALITFGSLIVTGSQVLSNTALGATSDGGGAYVNSGVLHAENTTFAGNVAGRDGGGVFAPGGGILTRDAFVNNKAGRFAGAGRLIGGTITGDQYLGNRSASEGGALRTSGDVTITHAVFQANISNLSGAIVHDQSGTLLLVDDLFARNTVTSTSGAAVLRVFDMNLRVINTTMADSTANPRPAISAFRSSVGVTNTLFANHLNSVGIDISSTLTFDYNLFFNVPVPVSGIDGGHNVIGDPSFVDAANGNFHLQPGSSAIDSGLDSAVPLFISTDLDGLPRLIDNPGVGSVGRTVDIGAYELPLQPVLVYLPLILR
jgi:predicted outer membrane repeat protein